MKISIRGVKRAFDLIYEHRPDQEIREILEGIIGQASELVMDHWSKSYYLLFLISGIAPPSKRHA